MHNPQDETYALDPNYLVRYHACQRILDAHGVSVELTSLRKVFPIISKDGLGVADYQQALQALLKFISNYGKPINYNHLNKEELDDAFLDECYVNTPDINKLRQLLELGADMHKIENPLGMPAYIRAMNAAKIELLQLFLERGADINYKYPPYPNDPPDYYHTFWLRSVMNTPLPNIQLMIQYGAKVQDTDSNGNNVLHLIGESRVHIDVLKLFISLGVDIQARNKAGETPLFIMSRNEINAESCIYLLQCGANPNIGDHAGNTPIHRLANWWQDKYNAIMQMQQSGANINAVNSEGKTALHIATEKDNPSVVQALLGVGANSQITTLKGQTAYDIAIAQGFLKVAVLFNENADADYQHRPEYQEIQQLKQAIIAALKSGKTWGSADKEGWRQLSYNNGMYRLEQGEHQSDYRHSYDYTEETVLVFLYDNAGYWDKKNKTELEIWKTVLIRLG